MDSDESGAVEGFGARAGWSREQAAGIERTPETTMPVFYQPEEPVDPDLWIWDTWFMRDRDGTIAEVDGYRVAFSLTAPSDMLPGKRHDVAAIRYFYSPDGRNWETGGRAFAEGEPFGSRQWAGSALYDDGDVYLYYTASGERGERNLTYTQRIAGASGGRFELDGDGLRLTGDWEHEVLLHPDGEYYETEAQSRGMIYTFRDPWFYEDPATGDTWLLFEANTPVPEGSDACGGDAAQQEFNGSIGIAHSPTGDPMDWELYPPLVDSVCVNQELERPHVVRMDGRYYLFVSSHQHTFAPGLRGYDALYGFVADELRGDYRPLNGHGMVATNPANAPFQSYSYVVFPHREEVLVSSFVNYVDFAGESLDLIADLPEAEQLRRFGGTLSPTVRVALDGASTRIVGKLGHAHVPLPREDLPDTWLTDRDGSGLFGEWEAETGATDAGERTRRGGYGGEY